ncbi:MAG: fumarylacetoacetate hydrolase family protein [Oligoflexia bacterium]|nr:fumarylacetoacetate hydrolase family protein [Oligoflexia bacterium]
MDKREIAHILFQADRQVEEIERFTKKYPQFGVEEGYEIQEILLEHHLKKGSHLVGWKMGMTSLAKMRQMNLKDPIHGFLTDEMQVSDKGVMSVKKRIHPKVEPEIAFLLKQDVHKALSAPEAFSVISCIAPALEVIDSRFKDFDFKLPDVVADNCSSSGFVVGGGRTRFPSQRLKNLGIVLEINGKAVQFGSSAAILGDPISSLIELSKIKEREGKVLRAGEVILAGGATAAVTFQAGDHVRALVEGLGSVEFFAKA